MRVPLVTLDHQNFPNTLFVESHLNKGEQSSSAMFAFLFAATLGKLLGATHGALLHDDALVSRLCLRLQVCAIAAATTAVSMWVSGWADL